MSEMMFKKEAGLTKPLQALLFYSSTRDAALPTNSTNHAMPGMVQRHEPQTGKVHDGGNGDSGGGGGRIPIECNFPIPLSNHTITELAPLPPSSIHSVNRMDGRNLKSQLARPDCVTIARSLGFVDQLCRHYFKYPEAVDDLCFHTGEFSPPPPSPAYPPLEAQILASRPKSQP